MILKRCVMHRRCASRRNDDTTTTITTTIRGDESLRDLAKEPTRKSACALVSLLGAERCNERRLLVFTKDNTNKDCCAHTTHLSACRQEFLNIPPKHSSMFLNWNYWYASLNYQTKLKLLKLKWRVEEMEARGCSVWISCNLSFLRGPEE